jgi:hypothetical protein
MLARLCTPQQSSAAQKLSALLQRGFSSFAVAPGSLLHIYATNAEVRISNQPGLEDAVQLDLPPGRCLAQQLPGGRIIGELPSSVCQSLWQQRTVKITPACPALLCLLRRCRARS